MQTAGPALERKADIAAFLTALEPRSVFFVDEIHRLPRAVEETFYPAMEDRQLPITVGAGAGARVVTLDLPPFTLIGATTRAGLLTTPLRDRFGIQHRLEHYGARRPRRGSSRRSAARARRRDRASGRARDRRALARHPARRQPPAQARARLRRGPRRRARSTPTAAGAALDLLEVDHDGPRPPRPRDPQRDLHPASPAGPSGLSTLAVAVGEEADTIEDVYEPYLLQRGLLQRTPRGPLRHRARLRAPRARAARGRRRSLF